MFSRCIAEFWCCQMDALAGRIHLKNKPYKKYVDNVLRVSIIGLNKV
jgi:hypothetical protein